jgi:hypothetical protein
VVGGILDRNKGGGMNDGIFEGLHSGGMLLVPDKLSTLACEVDKWACSSRVIFDPNSHESGGAKEGADVSDALTGWPVMDLGHLGVFGNATIVATLVS